MDLQSLDLTPDKMVKAGRNSRSAHPPIVAVLLLATASFVSLWHHFAPPMERLPKYQSIHFNRMFSFGDQIAKCVDCECLRRKYELIRYGQPWKGKHLTGYAVGWTRYVPQPDGTYVAQTKMRPPEGKPVPMSWFWETLARYRSDLEKVNCGEPIKQEFAALFENLRQTFGPIYLEQLDKGRHLARTQ